MATRPAAPKIVLVTGASGGLGAAIARDLARRGHRLALAARRVDRLDEVASEALRLGAAEARAFAADLADPETPGRLIGDVVESMGGLDVLINNAGFGLPGPFSRCEPADLRDQIEVNLTAPLMLARHALPHLIEARGMVVNVGSAITALPNAFLGAYGPTKAGLAYWNDAFRRELLLTGVRVCLVEPGPVATEFFGAVRHRTGPEAPSIAAPPLPGFITADVDDAASRIVHLLDHPRRRLSMLRRTVWPWRALGLLFRAWPALGDLAMGQVARNIRPGGRWDRRQVADPAVAEAPL